MSVVGSISIRDNASSVLKSIRQEQTALRKDAGFCHIKSKINKKCINGGGEKSNHTRY